MRITPPDLSLRNDSRGVSEVVGFLLIFALLTILLSINQAQFVPQENSEVEFQHFQDVQDDMIDVRSAISNAGQNNVSQYPTVQLGTNYPTRLFAVNPPPPTGALRTTQEYPIKIYDPEDNTLMSEISTRFLEYQNGYNEFEVGPIWYENSVLYLDERDTGGNVAVIEDQNIVPDNSNTAQVTALKNNYSEASAGRVTIEFYPVENITTDLDSFGDEIKIEIPTRLTKEYWDDELAGYDGYDESEFNENDGTINSFNLTVDTDSLRFNTVGINSQPEDGQSSARQGVSEDNGRETELPGDAVAFDDDDGDQTYDLDETAYTADEVGDNDLSGVDLIIERAVQTDAIDQTVSSLIIRDGVEIQTNGVLGFATDANSAGDLDASGATLESGNTQPITFEISKGEGAINLRNLKATSDDEISVAVDSNNAGGIDAGGATFESGNSKGVVFEITKGSGPIDLQDSEVVSDDGITATVDDNNAGGINAPGAVFESGNTQPIILEIVKGTGEIDIQNAEMTSDDKIETTIDSTNTDGIDASGAVLQSSNSKQISFDISKGTGNLDLKNARLVLPTSTTAEAAGNNDGNELFVNVDTGSGGTVVIDRNDDDATLDVSAMELPEDAELERGTIND